MNRVFFISDTHFGHKKLLELGARDFESIEAHDEFIIENWNRSVNKNDTVFHLGDLAVGNPIEKTVEILKRLNGRIKLVPGNHDTWGKLTEYSKVIKIEPTMVEYKKIFLLSHIPVHTQQLEFRGRFNIHGHLHSNLIIDSYDRYKNVSCEQINFTPIEIDELIMKLLKYK